jgi:hypothetical protein
MADVNCFKIDDIIDVISESMVKIDVEEMFALMKGVAPIVGQRPKIDLINLITGDKW